VSTALLGWAQIVVTLAVGLGGAGSFVALLRSRAERDKIHAEAANVTTEATDRVVGSSLKLLQPLEERAEKLEERSALLQRRVNELESMVETLKDTLAEERRLSRREINRLESENSQLRDRGA
jgi:predicted RNase H-like nuclease (RuvC/YqgF family)